MNNQNALRFLEEMLDLPSASLTGAERLSDVEAWDSLSTIAFIAQVDKQFGVPLPGNRVAACRTVADLCELIEEASARRAA